MRSIWNTNYSPPQSNTTIESNNTNNNTLHIERPTPQLPNNRQMSPPRQQLHLLQFNSSQQDTQRLPQNFNNSPIPREIMIKEDNHHPHQQQRVYPPALDPSWPGSRYDSSNFDNDIIKRRKLSSHSNPTENDHQQIKKIVNRSNPNNSHHLTSNTTLLSNSPTTDTYYHQSRRKKRDTKPPNANDIRPFVEVEKKNGDYVLPAEVDSWTVLSLGSVVWDRAAFHNQRYIYPVGYRVKK